MVKTRLNTRKSARGAAKPKKSAKEQEIGDANQTSKSAIERCKNWIQQQKKEKLLYEPDEINSEDSDDEAQQMRLETIPVKKNFIELISVAIILLASVDNWICSHFSRCLKHPMLFLVDCPFKFY